MTTRPLAGAALAALTALTLAACTSGAPTPDDGATTATSTDPVDQATEDSTEESTGTDEEPDGVAIGECEGILLEAGAELDGTDLGACMSAAMLAAGSGAHVVENSTGTSYAQYEWTPEFSMHVEGEVEVVIRGDDGWMLTPESGWVRGDTGSADPEEMMAGTMVELVRAFGDPRSIGSMLAQTDWTIVENGSVPSSEALADIAWLLEPTGSIEMFGVSASDVQLWLGADYLGVYYVATASAMGITDTTSNTFTQWGEPVDIPDVGE